MNRQLRTALMLVAGIVAVIGVAAAVWLNFRPVADNGPVIAIPIPESEAPAALRIWADAQAGSTKGAYQIMADKNTTYIAISGGLQSTKGYTVRIERITRLGNGWLIESRVIAPAPTDQVSTALSNPVGFFRTSRPIAAPWQVNIVEPEPVSIPEPGPSQVEVNADFAVALQWMDGEVLQLTGIAKVPDVSFAIVTGKRVVARADVQVKAGHFFGSIMVPGGHGKDLRLVATDPITGNLLGQVAIDRDIAMGVLYSSNFRVTAVRQSGENTVRVEGRARAFEAAFVVEIRDAFGKLLVRQPVMADEGGPAFGRFSEEIAVPGGVPAGAEAWFLTESAKDGSLTVELVAPITR